MILRGLVVAASGFIFIFMPGLPMRMLTRRFKSFDRDMLYWGIGTWFVALLPMLFLQSLLRQLILGPGPSDVIPEGAWRFLLPFLSSMLGAFVVQGALYVVLRWKRDKNTVQLLDGLSLGFGSGLVVQVFIGFIFISAGFRLTFGDLSTPIQRSLVEAPIHVLLLWLLAHLLYRAAVPIISGALGVLLSRAVAGRIRFLLLAIATYTVFESAFAFVQLGLGGQSTEVLSAGGKNLINLFITVTYYIIAFVLAYRWLLLQNATQGSAPSNRQIKQHQT